MSDLTDLVCEEFEAQYEVQKPDDHIEFVDEFFVCGGINWKHLRFWTIDAICINDLPDSLQQAILNSIDWDDVRDRICNYLDHENDLTKFKNYCSDIQRIQILEGDAGEIEAEEICVE